MTPPLLELLLSADPRSAARDTVRDWWAWHVAWSAQWASPIERAIAGGYCADRVGWAFASAYQAALRVLVPTLPAHAVAALCVTEEQGTAPKAMRSTLTRNAAGGWRLDGAKRWTTLGPEGAIFLVAARLASPDPGGRAAIRLVQVAAGIDGLHLESMPATSFVPEVPHARLRFEQVLLPDSALLAGDGYADYVKPFRTIEDLHVHAAVLAYLVRESRRLHWPADWTRRAVSTLIAMHALAALDPTSPLMHLALAGAMQAAEHAVQEADMHWQAASDTQAAARWQRDRALLSIAAQARAARLDKAMQALAERGPRPD